MRFSRGCLLIGGLLGLAGCLDAIPPLTIRGGGTGTLSGTIRNSCTEEAVAQANIFVTFGEEGGSRYGVTDSQGAFSIPGIPVGPVDITITRPEIEIIDDAGAPLPNTQGFVVKPVSATILLDQTTTINEFIAPLNDTDPAPKELDVLIVVDNSGSMSEEQNALASAMTALFSGLAQRTYDTHIGIVTTDVGVAPFGGIPSCEDPDGDSGELKVPSSGPKPSDKFVRFFGNNLTNVPNDDVAGALAGAVKVGVTGCGFEQPFSAIRKALTANDAPNFLRSNAALAVLVISDEDDCTATDGQLFDPSSVSITDPLGPLSSFRCFEFGVRCSFNDRTVEGFREDCTPEEDPNAKLERVSEFANWLTQQRDRVFFGVIAGPTSPVFVGVSNDTPRLEESCGSSLGLAVPAIRLHAAAQTFGPAGFFGSICNADLSSAVASFVTALAQSPILSACVTQTDGPMSDAGP